MARLCATAASGAGGSSAPCHCQECAACALHSLEICMDVPFERSSVTCHAGSGGIRAISESMARCSHTLRGSSSDALAASALNRASNRASVTPGLSIVRNHGTRSVIVRAVRSARSTIQRVAHAVSTPRRAPRRCSAPRIERRHVSDAASCNRRVAARSNPRPSAITAHTPGQRTACSIAQSRAPGSCAGTSTKSERSCSRASGHVRGIG